jgi:hypothetical protein
MPRHAVDYSKTVIYHFVCQDKTITCSYVGSTTNFIKRKNGHKSVCHKKEHHTYNYKLYQTIRDNGGWTNWSMIPLEEYPCENTTQQLIREQYWIEQLKPDLNSRKAYRNEEERVEYNIEYKKNYHETHKDEEKKYQETHKEQHNQNSKKYNESHKEQYKEYQKAYRLKQKISRSV